MRVESDILQCTSVTKSERDLPRIKNENARPADRFSHLSIFSIDLFFISFLNNDDLVRACDVDGIQ